MEMKLDKITNEVFLIKQILQGKKVSSINSRYCEIKF